jgi:hypothetical protein
VTTCRDCQHWTLGQDTLAQLGFGRCQARDDITRPAVATAAHNVCRIERFTPMDAQPITTQGGTPHDR